MIGSVALLLAMHGGPQLVQQSGAQVVNKVIVKYMRAKSLTGTILQTTSDGTGSVSFKTEVSYVKPGKLRIAQNRKARNDRNLFAVSDGRTFVYDHPRDTTRKVIPGDRLMDAVSGINELTGEPYTQSFGEMYAVTHTSMEPVTSLDIAFGYKPHLDDFKSHIVTVVLSGAVAYKGRQVYKVTGKWRYYKNGPQTGRWEMLVSSEYDILKFALIEPYQVGGRSVDLIIVETVDLKVDVKIDDSVFKVR